MGGQRKGRNERRIRSLIADCKVLSNTSNGNKLIGVNIEMLSLSKKKRKNAIYYLQKSKNSANFYNKLNVIRLKIKCRLIRISIFYHHFDKIFRYNNFIKKIGNI